MGIYSKYVFPRLMNFAMSGENFDEVRRTTLAGVRGHTLEIGFGTGLKLPHYPDSLNQLTTIDINPGMGRLAERRVQESQIEVQHRILSGESLPMDDATFDSVVSTWTLCSIPDVKRALGEIHGVLKSEGRFVVVEHGLGDESRVKRWQRRLTPIQKIFADGCHLDRDIEGIVTSAGFRIVEIEKFYLKKVPKIGGYLYRGIAVKQAVQATAG